MLTILLFVGMSLSPCQSLPQKETLMIPSKQMPNATSRARLADLLVESLRDTSQGKVDAARERMIRKLAKQLSKKGG